MQTEGSEMAKMPNVFGESKMSGGKLNQKSAPTQGKKSESGIPGNSGSPKHTGFKKGGKVKPC